MERRNLTQLSLVELLQKEYGRIRDKLKDSKFSIVECLSAGLALFGMKLPSLLQFDHFGRVDNPQVPYNISHLYGVKNVPSDTYFRERLDEVDEVFRLQYGIDKIISRLQNGKVLDNYKYVDDSYLVAIDGTGYFSSHEVHCVNCCEKHHRNGTTTYHHDILSAILVYPGIKPVFALALEPIQKQDGAKKNDCEHNAVKRLLKRLKLAHPRFKFTIVLDALYADAPVVSLIQELGWHYIIVAKDVDYLLDQFNFGGKKHLFVHTTSEVKQEYFFRSNLPLNEANQEIKTNVLEYQETHLTHKRKKDKDYHNIWLTDLTLDKSTVGLVVNGGRARWSIENETFNTLKNQGYQFGHNFGHGYNNLSTVMAYLMFTAFLIDQIQEATSKAFQKLLKKMKRKLYLWDKFRFLFVLFFFDSWAQFYALIENENGRYNDVLRASRLEEFINSS